MDFYQKKNFYLLKIKPSFIADAAPSVYDMYNPATYDPSANYQAPTTSHSRASAAPSRPPHTSSAASNPNMEPLGAARQMPPQALTPQQQMVHQRFMIMFVD